MMCADFVCQAHTAIGSAELRALFGGSVPGLGAWNTLNWNRVQTPSTKAHRGGRERLVVSEVVAVGLVQQGKARPPSVSQAITMYGKISNLAI